MVEPVKRRHVLLIPGFDPAPARTHRERYRREGAKQAAISGYQITLSADPAAKPSAWEVQAEIKGQTSAAKVEVLGWSDLVRDAMGGSTTAVFVATLRTAWTYLRSGALGRMMALRKGPILAVLYPVVLLVLPGLLGLLGTFLSLRLLDGVLGIAVTALVCAVWVALVIAAYAWMKARDGRFLVHYLLQDFAYAAQGQGAYPKTLSDRMAVFSDALIKAASGPADEVLLVGHSSGAALAVTVLADALRSGRIQEEKRLSLLTLGQAIPMVSFLPDAHRLRADLAYLSTHTQITWVDVSAPGDGCSFALCDPVAVSGVASPGQRWPLILSAAFSHTLSPQTLKRLRLRLFRLHFQYMCAFDQPGDYDFFAITAGPQTLGARFAGRAPSPSRIETPVNRHITVAP